MAAQGLWLRLLLIAHDADRYGYLAINGVPIQPAQLARMCGGNLEEYTALIAELDGAAVPSWTPKGVMYSRRMVADAQHRAENAEHQAKHRAKAKKESGNSKGEVRGMSDPSSELIVQSSISKKNGNKNVPGSRSSSVEGSGEELRAGPSLPDVLEHAKVIGLPDWKAGDWWQQFEAKGWLIGKQPVRDWRVLLGKQLDLWRRDGSPAKTSASPEVKAKETLKAKPNKYLDAKPFSDEEVKAMAELSKKMREALK